jgi:uncharacterized protein (TIGR03118 family)
MKNLMRSAVELSTVFATVLLITAGSAAADDHDNDADDLDAYQQTNLVSNVAGQAPTTDPSLRNAWGVASPPGGPLWISDNGTGLSTLYSGAGAIVPLTVTVPLINQSGVTGMVWNPNSGAQFLIPNTQSGAIFIFDGEDGTITGWNPAVDTVTAGKSTASILVDNSASGAVYTGLAYGINSRGTFIFATNFASGQVEAYNSTLQRTALDGAFTDPALPPGYAPFGISNIDGDLFVTYAKQDAAKHDPVVGDGLGFIDVFSTNGKLLRRFASRGVLNAPWGVVRAPIGFGRFGGDILVGNFGSRGHFAGWINAFGNRGQLAGELRTSRGQPVEIDGLWALTFGTFAASDGDTLYFTAGPHHESDGLFGKIAAVASRR